MKLTDEQQEVLELASRLKVPELSMSNSDCKDMGLPQMPESSNAGLWEAWRIRVRCIRRVREAEALLAFLKETR